MIHKKICYVSRIIYLTSRLEFEQYVWPTFGKFFIWNFDLVSIFKKYSIFGQYSGSNSRTNSGPISTRAIFKYQYFGQLWSLMVKSSRINLSYSRFWPFMGHSQQYSTRGRVTHVRSIKFMTRLRTRLGLGLDLAIFASSTNVESGPRFARIWSTHFCRYRRFSICSHVYLRLDISKK